MGCCAPALPAAPALATMMNAAVLSLMFDTCCKSGRWVKPSNVRLTPLAFNRSASESRGIFASSRVCVALWHRGVERTGGELGHVRFETSEHGCASPLTERYTDAR